MTLKEYSADTGHSVELLADVSTTDHFHHLPLVELAPSLTNPRKNFNPAKLTELKKALKTSSAEGPAAQATGAGGGAQPKDKAKKAAPAVAKNARAKLSAQEAITGIAAAMQGIEAASADAVAPLSPPATGQGADQPDGPQDDTPALPFPVGTAVRIIKDTAKLQVRLHKHAGKAGTVTALLGVNVRDVSFKGRTAGIAAFDLSELEAA